MSEKGLAIELHCDSPVTVLADAALIHRMIANLFDNALKHLDNGCRVSVGVSADDTTAFLTIEDNGPGFDPAILANVFQARVKGRKSTGHGLGLAFVSAVARAHGGTATVFNQQLGGSRIIVQLPRSQASPTAIEPVATHV